MTRVAVITGAGTGIGAAVARLFAAHGLEVVLVGRRAEPLEAVREELGGRALVISADIGDAATPALIVERTLAEFGQLDVIVNNAAVIEPGPIDGVTRAAFERHYAVNVAGPFFLVTAALPALRASDDAAVVNISSSLGTIVMADTTLYGSTKAALDYMTRAWAYELAKDRIRVNAVAPGGIDTPIHETYSDDVEATRAELARRLPIGRLGAPEEVATWVWSLVAPDSAFTTGTLIHVDGGHVLGLPASAGG
jgi:NAD(P)-dependent dehydrogenase (short-subunit alcohol dehydrogenase family)